MNLINHSETCIVIRGLLGSWRAVLPLVCAMFTYPCEGGIGIVIRGISGSWRMFCCRYVLSSAPYSTSIFSASKAVEKKRRVPQSQCADTTQALAQSFWCLYGWQQHSRKRKGCTHTTETLPTPTLRCPWPCQLPCHRTPLGKVDWICQAGSYFSKPVIWELVFV